MLQVQHDDLGYAHVGEQMAWLLKFALELKEVFMVGCFYCFQAHAVRLKALKLQLLEVLSMTLCSGNGLESIMIIAQNVIA